MMWNLTGRNTAQQRKSIKILAAKQSPKAKQNKKYMQNLFMNAIRELQKIQ